MTGARLVYERWTHPVAEDVLSARSTIALQRLDLAEPPAEGWRLLKAAHGYQVVNRTDGARVAGGAQWAATEHLIARCPELLAVCVSGAGYDVVDVAACTAAGIIVCNNSGPGAEAVAEHALGLMIALAKNVVVADRAMRAGSVHDRNSLMGSELRSKTLGLIGLGAIGARLVELCRPFHMEVLAHDPYVSEADARRHGAELVSLDELLSRADFVQVVCPLTDETAGLIRSRELSLMKPTSYFITTARGGIHDEAALLEALRSGRIAGAGLDVFEAEPVGTDDPLLAEDNVIATPHIAGITREAAHELARATADQWITILDGHVPRRLVNPDAWPHYQDRFARAFGVRPPDLMAARPAYTTQ